MSSLYCPATDPPSALALCRRVDGIAEMLQPLAAAVTVAMDHGVAIFPRMRTGDRLIRIAMSVSIA